MILSLMVKILAACANMYNIIPVFKQKLYSRYALRTNTRHEKLRAVMFAQML